MNSCKHCNRIFVRKRKEQVYCSKSCASVLKGMNRKGMKTGPNKSHYKMRMTKDGYLRVYCAHHPFADGRKQMLVHDMVMELHVGRRLRRTEVVHHKNGIKTDNRIENLEIMSHSQHSKMHMSELAPFKRRNTHGQFA